MWNVTSRKTTEKAQHAGESSNVQNQGQWTRNNTCNSQVPPWDTYQRPALHQPVHGDLHRGGAKEREDHAPGAEPAAKGDVHGRHEGHHDRGSAGGAGLRVSCKCCCWSTSWKSGGSWRSSSGCHSSVPSPSHSSCYCSWSGTLTTIKEMQNGWHLEKQKFIRFHKLTQGPLTRSKPCHVIGMCKRQTNIQGNAYKSLTENLNTTDVVDLASIRTHSLPVCHRLAATPLAKCSPGRQEII